MDNSGWSEYSLRVAGLCFRDRVWSLDLWRELEVEQLLHVGSSQQSLFRHLIRMPPGSFSVEVSGQDQLGRDPEANLELTASFAYLIWLVNALRTPREELGSIAGERMPGIHCLACCHHDPG